MIAAEDISRARDVRLESELASRGIVLKGHGVERYGPCPRCGGKDRFSINVRKQLWLCRGCDKGGNVIALVEHLDGVSFREAVTALVGIDVYDNNGGVHVYRAPSGKWQGDNASLPQQPVYDKTNGVHDHATSEMALAIWFAALPPAGTLAATYLTGRGLIVPDTDALRFHPACPFGGTTHPCMLALYRDVQTNEPRGVMRTALTASGMKMERRALGHLAGAAVKLSDDEDITYGLHIAEGVETAIASLMRGFAPVWAVGNAGAMRAFPIIAGVDSLTVIADNDAPGLAAANECSDRWLEAERECRRVIPDEPGCDMADLVRDAS